MIEVFLIISVCILYVYSRWKRPSGVPRGPLRFPFVGCFPQILLGIDGSGLSTLFFKWSKTYGPIFSVDLGSFPAVVLNNAAMIREAFGIPQLCGRVQIPVAAVRMGDDGVPRGIIFNYGQTWIDQRRFSIRHLKDFGLGKNTMESIILDEVQDLLKTFRKTLGKPISTQAVFNVAIINSLWAIVAGQRFSHDDPKLQKMVAGVIQNLAETGTSGVMLFFPTLAKMFPKLSGWDAYLESFYTTHLFIEDFVKTRIRDHKDGQCHDFTDAYIEQINHTKDSCSSFYKDEGERNLVTALDDMFNAGGETTSTALTWFMLCLAVHPEVQEKLHGEIDHVIGRERLPTLSDRPRMLYAEAVISEVLRIASIVPIGVLHNCVQDTVFHGMLIPKDTIVISNIQGVHHDPLVWGDPQNFRPERFLSPDGKSGVSFESFIPFSTGKRACLGENLAKDELFLMTTSIFQELKVLPDPSAPVPTLTLDCQGIVAKPQPHKIIFNPR